MIENLIIHVWPKLADPAWLQLLRGLLAKKIPMLIHRANLPGGFTGNPMDEHRALIRQLSE